MTEEQIRSLSSPTRPTKKTDSRAKSFEGESVEVDAIAPATLRVLVRNCIEKHIDHSALERTKLVEEQERETLARILMKLPKGGAQ